MSGSDLDNSFVSFTATAAFALPEPYGVITSGAITFFQSIFGGSSDETAREFKAAVKAILTGVQALLEMEDIGKDADAIQDAATWLSETTEKTAALGQTRDPESTMADTLSALDGYFQQDSPLRLALTNLARILKAPISSKNNADSVGAMRRRLQALDLYGMGIALFLTERRLRLQIHSKVNRGQPNYEDRIYDYYFDFHADTERLATEMSEIILALSDRLMGFLVEESEGLPPLRTYSVFNHFTGQRGESYPALPAHQAREKWHAAKRAWDGQIDAMMSASRKLVHGFSEKLRDWGSSLRPSIAPAGPVPESAAPGAGTDAVRYALSFANKGGEGPRGPYGEAAAALSKTRLKDIAVDRLGLALSRKIYRQVGTADPVLVTIIPDNTTTTWDLS
jgi:hypothetical protein